LKDIELDGYAGDKWNYSGMVNKSNQPHGFGRAIETDNNSFLDAQFKNGLEHGY
jgi:hypothetical protein